MNNNIIIEVKNLKYKYRSIRRIDDKNEASIEYKEA